MLHSTLPRAFLAPGLSYLGYYGEEVHQPYGPATTWHIPMEDSPSSYSRIHEQHGTQTWDSSRSSTPCPLDLSLKAPGTPSTPKTEDEPIEVDDDNDRRIREEAHRRFEAARYKRDGEDDPLIVDDLEALPRSSSVHSHRSYEQLILPSKEPVHLPETMDKPRMPEETTHLPGYPINEIAHKYHPHNPKLLLSSPSHLHPAQSYHQQLLLTPQHQLQGMHAPMTPPSTPSPPQCPRRRYREEDGSSSTSSAPTTPRQSTNTEKPSQKPKKKHARRLKFDEDTSSPVSGTVILGPDEAVVTGDIDPAFNIVEVTEEARAELAKIENRLGPYQCKLCRQLHEDAFQLAQHRCSRIAHVEYRCPECDKRFSCPANLASHRRWHKPRLPTAENSGNGPNAEIPCTRCEAKFTRQAALRKHLASQHPETNNNVVAEAQETIGKQDAPQLPTDGTIGNEMP